MTPTSDIPAPRAPGRARDAAATRQAIADTARPLFARLGYRGATVRAIADAAGVSPNLITRYFGGKEGLFLEATRTSIIPSPVLDGPLSGLGARLADGIVERWADVDVQTDPMLTLQRASGERPEAAEALATFLDERSLDPLRRYLRSVGMSDLDADDRAIAIDALVLGISTRRRFLRADLGDLRDRERLRSWLAASIQRLVA